MPNILFFIFRLYGGGAERVVSNLSIAFADKYNVKVAIYDNQRKEYPYKGELIRIHLPFSDDPTRNTWWQRLIRLVLLIYKVRKIKREHKIDVAISFAEQANIVNILTRGNRRTIISVRTLLSKEIANTPKMKILGHFIKSLYNKAHQVIVPSQLAAQDLRTYFGIAPNKLNVIYNYIDQEKIDMLSAEEIEEQFYQKLFQQPVLLNVGRITPAKGQWLLFQLMQRIKPIHPDWKLVIIGESETEGNLKTQLNEMAGQLGLKVYDGSPKQAASLNDDVYLLGFNVNPFKFMRKSSILVFPSVYEGFPNTVLEAMQCGLPVIVADCQSGPREILAPGSDLDKKTTTSELTDYGILCPALPVADIKIDIPVWIIDEWENSINILMNENTLRDKFVQNGYMRVKNFDKDTILQQWEKSIDAG